VINLYSQTDSSAYISISADENNLSHVMVILHYKGNADTMALHPSGAKLVDYLVETPDSASYVLSHGNLYVFTKMDKKGNQWTSTIKRMGGLKTPILSPVNQQSKINSVKILDYDTIVTSINGKIEKLQLQEK
jgi:hypothetical protein